jgi:chemotaxis methyl-accepting protein methylase
MVDDEDNNFYFSLVTISSYLFYINFNNKNNSWLINTRATNYITYNIINFLDYIKINNLDIINIVNSLIYLKEISII